MSNSTEAEKWLSLCLDHFPIGLTGGLIADPWSRKFLNQVTIGFSSNEFGLFRWDFSDGSSIVSTRLNTEIIEPKNLTQLRSKLYE